MNIVIITHILPYPLYHGGAQAQYNMIDQLRHNHHITLIFSEGSVNKLQAMKQLQALWPEVNIVVYRYYRQLRCWRFVRDKIKRGLLVKFAPKSRMLKIDRMLKPYGQWFSSDQVRFINRIIREAKADLIQVEFFPCLGWCKYLPDDVKKIFVHHEINFIRNDRFLQDFHLSAKEEEAKQRMKQEEIDCLNHYDHIITLTDTDKKILQEHHVTSPVSVSPAAVSSSPLPYCEWKGRVVFIGGHTHIPNKEGIDWFVSQVVPNLNSHIQVDLIGAGWPLEYVIQHEHCQIRLTGFVDNLTAAIYGNIMIVPILTGSGMRMKIIEAMAMSMPIVTTTVGVEGIPLVHEESCLIADSPIAFAQAIERLCSDASLRSKLGNAANHVFMEGYTPQQLAKVRDSIYQHLVRA
jgi:glycosyltransferase involved in cell wall biosynthesis